MRAKLLFALTVILTIGTLSTADAQRRVALVIGNSAYTAVPALSNPRNDAEAMASTLSELGFDVTTAIDADLRGMSRAIRTFGKTLKAAGRDAVGLFYFAGHGVQSRGSNYLVPLGAAIENEADLELEAISTSTILSQMEAANNGLNLVILDACRNNPLKSSSRSSNRGLARVQAASGTLVAFAAAPGQVAADGAGTNSPYTAALVKAMRQPGLSVEEVFKQVRISVERETGGKQTPWEESSLTGAFQFAQATVSDAPVARSNAPAPAPDGYDKEALFWQSIKGSRNPATFRAYLKKFPDGVFSELAKLRLQELVTTQPAASDPGNSDANTAPPPNAGVQDQRALVFAIQKELARHRCNPGLIDGAWGRRSAQALSRFAGHAGINLASLDPSPQVLDQLRSQTTRICPLQCQPPHVEQGGECVLKGCAAGEVLSPTGACVPDSRPAPRAVSLAGQWGYAGKCPLFVTAGTTVFQMTGPNRFAGSHSSPGGASGPISNGRLIGSKVTYTARYTDPTRGQAGGEFFRPPCSGRSAHHRHDLRRLGQWLPDDPDAAVASVGQTRRAAGARSRTVGPLMAGSFLQAVVISLKPGVATDQSGMRRHETTVTNDNVGSGKAELKQIFAIAEYS